MADVGTEELRLTGGKFLGDQVTSSRALLTSAEGLISSVIKQSDLNQVQSGQVLLQKGNTALKQALQELVQSLARKQIRSCSIDVMTE